MMTLDNDKQEKKIKPLLIWFQFSFSSFPAIPGGEEGTNVQPQKNRKHIIEILPRNCINQGRRLKQGK